MALLLLTLLCVSEILLFWHFHPEQGRDSILYIVWIQRMHQGNFHEVVKAWPRNYGYPPFYLYLSNLCMYLGLSAETAGVVVSMSCASVLPLVIFGIAYEITCSTRISLASALIAAVHPTIIEYGCSVLREIPYLCFISITLYFFFAGIRRRKWYFFLLSGAFCAFALLTRYEAAEFIPLVLCYGLIALCCRQEKWYRILRNTVLWFVALGLGLWALLQLMQLADANISGRYQTFFVNKYRRLISTYSKPISPVSPKAMSPAPQKAQSPKTTGTPK